MSRPSDEWIAWRRSLLDWMTDHPHPDGEEDPTDSETAGIARCCIVLVEHVTSDGTGPWLHHVTADLDGTALSTWREEGMLRSALRSVVSRDKETWE